MPGFFQEAQKIFSSFAVGSSRVPIRGNIYSGKGYQPIGTTNTKVLDIDRKSPLLGNANPSNAISGYYDRILELKGYQLLDIVKLATNFFSDYITAFLSDDNGAATQIVTITNEDGSNNEQVSERMNKIMLKDLKIFDFIKDHIQDYVFFGQYYAMILPIKDETGHTTFKIEELLDPVSVIKKRKKNFEKGEDVEVYLAKSDDNAVYEIPKKNVIYLATQNLRLTNDLNDQYNNKSKNDNSKPITRDRGFVPPVVPSVNGPVSTQEVNSKSKYILKDGINVEEKDPTNKNKVLAKEFYSASEPLFYSLILKVKELIIKEILVSLISLRDLSSVQIFLLQFDKSTPLENAQDTCARAQKLTNSTNELASFLSSQFDAVSFIENTLTQSAKFVPDYGSTVGAKNAMLPLDKLSDKILDIMQTIDQCKMSILGPLGLPISLTDSSSGSKWQVLQQSERANSRVSSFLDGIKTSMLDLVCNIYNTMYNEKLDPSRVKLHINEKTSVEYNNQINQSESINGLLQGISGVLQNTLQVMDMATPLLDPAATANYVRNLIKDIDPNTESIITDETINEYVQLAQGKKQQMFEQYGISMDGGGQGEMM